MSKDQTNETDGSITDEIMEIDRVKFKLPINGIEWSIPFSSPPQTFDAVSYQKVTLWILALIKHQTANGFKQNNDLKMIWVNYSDRRGKKHEFVPDFIPTKETKNARYLVICTLIINHYRLFILDTTTNTMYGTHGYGDLKAIDNDKECENKGKEMLKWIINNQTTQLLSNFNIKDLNFVNLNHDYKIWKDGNCGLTMALTTSNFMEVINHALTDNTCNKIESLMRHRLKDPAVRQKLTVEGELEKYLTDCTNKVFSINDNQYNKNTKNTTLDDMIRNRSKENQRSQNIRSFPGVNDQQQSNSNPKRPNSISTVPTNSPQQSQDNQQRSSSVPTTSANYQQDTNPLSMISPTVPITNNNNHNTASSQNMTTFDNISSSSSHSAPTISTTQRQTGTNNMNNNESTITPNLQNNTFKQFPQLPSQFVFRRGTICNRRQPHCLQSNADLIHGPHGDNNVSINQSLTTHNTHNTHSTETGSIMSSVNTENTNQNSNITNSASSQSSLYKHNTSKPIPPPFNTNQPIGRCLTAFMGNNHNTHNNGLALPALNNIQTESMQHNPMNNNSNNLNNTSNGPHRPLGMIFYFYILLYDECSLLFNILLFISYI